VKSSLTVITDDLTIYELCILVQFVYLFTVTHSETYGLLYEPLKIISSVLFRLTRISSHFKISGKPSPLIIRKDAILRRRLEWSAFLECEIGKM
jgi:hypothetical protein